MATLLASSAEKSAPAAAPALSAQHASGLALSPCCDLLLLLLLLLQARLVLLVLEEACSPRHSPAVVLWPHCLSCCCCSLLHSPDSTCPEFCTLVPRVQQAHAPAAACCPCSCWMQPTPAALLPQPLQALLWGQAAAAAAPWLLCCCKMLLLVPLP
jgi:hypothetical protein